MNCKAKQSKAKQSNVKSGGGSRNRDSRALKSSTCHVAYCLPMSCLLPLPLSLTVPTATTVVVYCSYCHYRCRLLFHAAHAAVAARAADANPGAKGKGAAACALASSCRGGARRRAALARTLRDDIRRPSRGNYLVLLSRVHARCSSFCLSASNHTRALCTSGDKETASYWQGFPRDQRGFEDEAFAISPSRRAFRPIPRALEKSLSPLPLGKRPFLPRRAPVNAPLAVAC